MPALLKPLQELFYLQFNRINACSLGTLLFLGNLGGAEIILIFFVFLLPGILWLWALIDILKSNFKDNSSKIVWLLVVIFVPVLGVLLYFIIGRNQRLESGQQN